MSSYYVQNLKHCFVSWVISGQKHKRSVPSYDAVSIVAKDQHGTKSPKINKSDKELATSGLAVCRARIALLVNQVRGEAVAKRSIRHLYHMYGTTLPPSVI
ncbi:hypothetical protein KRX19_07845 [Cardiobacteriaceae bacterium TAE3-ERU3]|nr:hypothetical protein [Cardiobacteriaceae bacterium TAE3-ERU3]